MTLRWLLLIVTALVGGCRSAPTEASIEPLLWRLEKDGHRSYVLGTMHAGIEPARVPAIVWWFVGQSRTFVCETDLSGLAQISVTRSDGKRLRDELSATQWKTLETTLGAERAGAVDTLQPMIAATLVAMHGLPRTAAIDGALLAQAKQAGKPIVYLEPLAQQMAMIERLLDIRVLRHMLDDLPGVERASQRMLDAFAAGDAGEVHAVVTRHERDRWLSWGRTAEEFEAQLEDALYRRNASWIDAIDAAHQRGGAFIAVGAAHTVGPRSVIDLMGQRGYKVARVARSAM